MSLTARELAQLLQRGIAAAKAGEREMARDLLMRVVEQDERNIQAWLWLSQVVTRPDERQICLENVLAIDPNHQAARRGLELLNQQTPASARLPRPSSPTFSGAPSLAAALLRPSPQEPDAAPADQDAVYTPPSVEESYRYSTKAAPTLAAALLRKTAEPPPAQAEPRPPAPPSAYPTMPRWSELEQDAQALLSEFDNEELCPYCAEPTAPNDPKCKACGGQLWRTVPRLKRRSSLLWFIILLLVMLPLWQVYAFLVWGFFFVQPFYTLGKLQTVDQFIGLYLGQSTVSPEIRQELFGRLPPLYLWIFVFAIAAQFILALLIYWRWRPLYWLVILLASINALYMISGVVGSAQPVWMQVFSIIAAVAPLMLLFLVQQDFMVQRERIWSGVDKDIHTHSAYYARGREYARRKMWTQAVIHLRRAVAEAPGMIAYHLALASAYAQLKRYERAEAVLKEVMQLDPANREARKLLRQIVQQRAAVYGLSS